MRIFLLFLSLLWLLPAPGIFAQTEPDKQQKREYAFELSTAKSGLTGVAIMREQGDSILGSMVNEFGVSAIDFIYIKSKNKVKLVNLIGFLNKWYVKPTLKGDIRHCIATLYDLPVKPGKHYAVQCVADTVVIENKKRHLTYRFSPLSENTDETD